VFLVADLDAIRWLRLTDDEVGRLHTDVAEVLVATPEVSAAYHYGSSARGQPARDIDIGIVVDREAMRTVDVGDIGARLAAASGRRSDVFDVRVINEADPVFLGNVMREGKRCYERDLESRVAFEVQAMNSWLDFQPVWDRLRNRVLGAWSRG
jgi:predicted nucleotidyltransferase